MSNFHFARYSGLKLGHCAISEKRHNQNWFLNGTIAAAAFGHARPRTLLVDLDQQNQLNLPAHCIHQISEQEVWPE
jgi:hypothetical protein